MTEKKTTTITTEQIAHFLKQTGFIFEMRMNDVLLKRGYACEIGSSFYDLDGDTEREIDLVASKTFSNGITAHFVIECKQSLLDKWIFICIKSSDRYYYAVKHLPHVDLKALQDKKLFSHLHTFDRKIPLAHNYICYSTATNRKTEHLQIDECVYKLPKAVAYFASSVKEGRHLFFPVGLFSGQIFTVRYQESPVVEERNFLQFFTAFRSGAYSLDVSEILDTSPFPRSSPLRALVGSKGTSRAVQIKVAARDLVNLYQLDFVTESGLQEYLAVVENEVEAIRIDDWPLPTAPEKPATQ
jgi:hypothetical protein